MPPKPRFDRERLQKAALKIVDEKGLNALSMRSLAGVLRTGAMTLYNYVSDRDALDALIVEAVLAEARWPAPTGDWRDDVHAVATATWRAVRAHPNAIPLILTRRGFHEATLRPAEALLEALAAGGFRDAALLAAFRAVHGFIMGFAMITLAPAPGGTVKKPEVMTAVVAALPADRFPSIIEVAQSARTTNPDEVFGAALAIVLAGLDSASVKPRPDGRAPILPARS